VTTHLSDPRIPRCRRDGIRGVSVVAGFRGRRKAGHSIRRSLATGKNHPYICPMRPDKPGGNGFTPCGGYHRSQGILRGNPRFGGTVAVTDTPKAIAIHRGTLIGGGHVPTLSGDAPIQCMYLKRYQNGECQTHASVIYGPRPR